jgi:hypothetical protein
MDGRPTEQATSQLEELIQTVGDLRRRVQALEQRAIAEPSGTPLLAAVPAPPLVEIPPDISSGLLAGIGRLLLGIAGAYLLRAITEAGILPQLAGTLIGLAYACVWLVSSVRIASHNRLLIALQGLTASLIAAPLLWESTVRFHTLSSFGAAAALALFVSLGQLVAWRRDLSLIAGITALAGCATAMALIIATLDPVPFTLALLICAAVAEYGACLDRALGFRWIIAATLDFCAFLLIYTVTRPQGIPEGYAPIPRIAVVSILIALAAIYLASTATRSLIRRLSMAWFEMFQVAAAIALAVGGGLQIARGSTQGVIAIGAACLVAGAISYLVAFTKLARRPAIGRNFHAYATFGFLLIAVASSLLLSSGICATLWAALALTATWLGEKRNGNTLRMHGALYLLAAAAMSGLLPYGAQRMTGVSVHDWLPLTASALVCAIAAALGYGIALWRKIENTWQARIPSAILAAIFSWSVVGLAAGLLIGPHFNSPYVSVLRSAFISVTAIALAWCGRRWDLIELTWILYPWMIFGAVKLFTEDFQQGRSETLFLSLLLYGGTLIVLPRLVRRARPERSDLS